MAHKQRGQAAIEYLFVLVFMVIISTTILRQFNVYFRDSLGNLGHELSMNLTIGTCPTTCWFAAYQNGFGP